MNWTKASYRKDVEQRLKEELRRRGYSFFAKDFSFIRPTGPDPDVTARVSYQVTTANQPPTVVGIHPSGSIRIGSVAKICEDLFGRSAETATISAPLGAFTSANANQSVYRFDWADTAGSAFEKLSSDLDQFDSFASAIQSVQDLSADRLARVPNLRRNFAEGLGETYKYTTPEVAAVIHHLNGDRERAVSALALARRLGPEQRAKVADFIDHE